MAPCMPLTSEPPEVSRERRMWLSRRWATTPATMTAAAPRPARIHGSSANRVPAGAASQPVEIATIVTSAAPARTPLTICRTRTGSVRSWDCSTAPNATAADAPAPAASAHPAAAIGASPLSSATSPPIRPASRNAPATASQRRPRNSLPRLIGASISQNPSAEDTMTGPIRRDTANASAHAPNSTAHGSSDRPDTQAADVQPATVRDCDSTRFVTIAPTRITAKIA